MYKKIFHINSSTKLDLQNLHEKNMKSIQEHITRNVQLLEALEQEKDIYKFIEKSIEFQNDLNLLVGKINIFRKEMKKIIGIKVPPKLVLNNF